jgi:uncharacterized protein (DUF1697 family)
MPASRTSGLTSRAETWCSRAARLRRRLAAKPKPSVVKELAAAAVEAEQIVHSGRELYAWHPKGVGRSKLAALLSGPRLGVTATARNWATVTKLLAMADE